MLKPDSALSKHCTEHLSAQRFVVGASKCFEYFTAMLFHDIVSTNNGNAQQILATGFKHDAHEKEN